MTKLNISKPYYNGGNILFYTITRFHDNISKPYYNGGLAYYDVSQRDFTCDDYNYSYIPDEAKIPYDSPIAILLALGCQISEKYSRNIEDIHLRLHERVLSKTGKLLKASKIFDICIDWSNSRKVGEKREIIFGDNNQWKFVVR